MKDKKNSENVVKEIMGLVFKRIHAERDGYSDTAKDIMDEEIESKLHELLNECIAARDATIKSQEQRIAELEKDARRWKEVAFGSNPFLGVFYVDSFGNELMLCAQDAIDVVDESIKIYMQKD